MENKIDFGKQLKKTRKRLGLTQAQLAEKLGITIQAVSNYERGKGSPTIKTVCRFAFALGVSASDLIGETTAHKIDFDAWEHCKNCATKGCTTCTNHICGLGDEPCAKCTGTDLYIPLAFCPYCGRPLTDAARELLEHRLGK